jgi:endonuclease/exonuclease/phosphatase family metal-dependent hydrolase
LGFGNAVLSRFPIVSADSLPLPVEPGDEPRSLLCVEIDAPFARVPFFTTHLSWKLHQGAIRRQQVLFIAEQVRRLAPTTGFPPILTGDFNAEPESDEIRFLRGLATVERHSVYFADAFALVGDGPGYTFARSNRFAAPLCEPNRRLDYIFVRGPDRQLRGEVVACTLAFDRPDGDCFPSDHYGVVADLEVAPRKIVTP